MLQSLLLAHTAGIKHNTSVYWDAKLLAEGRRLFHGRVLVRIDPIRKQHDALARNSFVLDRIPHLRGDRRNEIELAHQRALNLARQIDQTPAPDETELKSRIDLEIEHVQ